MYVKAATLAAAALLAWVAITPASAAGVENGLKINGRKFNGLQLNGWRINGPLLRRISMQSLSPQGLRLKGVRMNAIEPVPAELEAAPSVLAIGLPGSETMVRCWSAQRPTAGSSSCA